MRRPSAKQSARWTSVFRYRNGSWSIADLFPGGDANFRYGWGVTLGVGVWLLFSRSLAAFAVAWRRRSESDLSRTASGVDSGFTSGFTLVSGLFDLEQPASATRPTARTRSENFFMMNKLLLRPRNIVKAKAPQVALPHTSAGVGMAAGASTHLPCSRIRSCKRPTASASGMLNFTAVLPT